MNLMFFSHPRTQFLFEGINPCGNKISWPIVKVNRETANNQFKYEFIQFALEFLLGFRDCLASHFIFTRAITRSTFSLLKALAPMNNNVATLQRNYQLNHLCQSSVWLSIHAFERRFYVIFFSQNCLPADFTNRNAGKWSNNSKLFYSKW